MKHYIFQVHALMTTQPHCDARTRRTIYLYAGGVFRFLAYTHCRRVY